MKKLFNIIILIGFLISIIYIYDKETITLLKEEFIINQEERTEIIKNLEAVENRTKNEPLIYEEVIQEGISILNLKEDNNDNKKIVSFTLKSNEKHISYDEIDVKVDLYNEKKELVISLKENIKHFKPNTSKEIIFDITEYESKYYKVSYQTIDFTIIK